MAFIEAFPESSKSGVGEEVWTSEVLPTRAAVFNDPCMILVRTDDQNRCGKPRLLLGLVFVFGSKPELKR